MDAFATPEQYEARFGAPPDEGVLRECLADCTLAIMAELDAHGIDYSDPDEALKARLASVCRSMASRVMPQTDGLPQGATALTESANGFSRSVQLVAGYSAPRMLDGEMRMLGIGGTQVLAIEPEVGEGRWG